MPFRSLQVGPVWRAERPQKGRYRQFYQCDIDMIGEASVLAEAEHIEATTEALAVVGLDGDTVRVSDRRFLSALATECGVPADAWGPFFVTVDKLDKIGWDGVRSELVELGLIAGGLVGGEDDPGAGRGTRGPAGGGSADSLPELPAEVIGPGRRPRAWTGWPRNGR